ncbi:MAG TPA: TlpA disulfide reductase family protein, partial [Bacteroidota bacterium]
MTAPDFSLSTLTGETRKFADVRGAKLTVLVFWSTWSAKSAQALTRMEKLHGKYREKGLAIVAVNADGQKTSPETLAEIRATQEKLKIDFPMLVDRGLVSFHDYGVIALPTIIVMDRERVIRRELSGYPLVGSEELADYIVAAFAGERQQAIAAKTGYQPNQNALRLYAMGETALKSRQGAEMAELWFKKAGAADPAFVLPHLSLGKIYLRRGDTDLALG